MLDQLYAVLYLKKQQNSSSTSPLSDCKHDTMAWYSKLVDIDKKYNIEKFMEKALDISEDKHDNADLLH
jgi:hypothetical protein